VNKLKNGANRFALSHLFPKKKLLRRKRAVSVRAAQAAGSSARPYGFESFEKGVQVERLRKSSTRLPLILSPVTCKEKTGITDQP